MTSTNQTYVDQKTVLNDHEQKLRSKHEKKIEKKLQKKNAKITSNQNYSVARKASRWLGFKRAAIIFLVLSVVFALSFILMKYLNYYFSFGPMDEATKQEFSGMNWWEPFNEYNWSIANDFQNFLPATNADGSTNQVVVQGLFWNGTEVQVTRLALIGNNFANILLFILAPTSLAIGILSTMAHWMLGRSRAKAAMNNYIVLVQAETLKTLKVSDFTSDHKVDENSTSSNITYNSTIYNLKEKEAQLQKPEIITITEKSPIVVEKQVEAPQSSVVTTKTHVHKIQPTTTIIEEHTWEKADPLPKVKKQRKSYPSIGKSDFVGEIYNDLKGTLTVKELNNIYDLTFDSIVSELESDSTKDISIFNFGKFTSTVREGRNGINPLTGESIWIDQSYQLKFGPSTTFKKTMENAKIKETTTKKVTKTVTKKG